MQKKQSQLIQTFKVNHNAITLKRSLKPNTLMQFCCSCYIQPINAIAKGELLNPEPDKRNALISLTSLDSGQRRRPLSTEADWD